MFVSEFSIWVRSAHDKYLLFKNKLKQSKDDPPTDPYRSKYEAKEMLNPLISEIETKWISFGNIQVKLLYALFNYEIGMIAVETDETSTGCEALNTSWETIKDIANSTEGCHLALKVLNQLAIIWSERGENQKAIDYLLQAENIYNLYKAANEICPCDCEDLFVLENKIEKDWSSFEKTFTHTLYYIAQVYELSEQSEKAANYCKETLKRQRESGDYETIDWALNCSTLSQYYVKNKLFEEARHLLCCAVDAANKRESELEENKIDEEKDIWGEFHQTKASIACSIIKYCIAVLRDSHSNLETKHDHFDKQTNVFIRVTDEEKILKMEKELPLYVYNFEEAKNVFLIAVKHISEAKLHYTLNQYANNYVQIIQDHSNLYKYLSYYEQDLSRQCKMFKRRIDMLQEVLRKLNPQFYLSVCRQLQFELGEIYLEMMDSKFKIAQSSSESLTQHTIKKINSLITQGMSHFSAFIKSFQDKNEKNPETYSEDDVRPVLVAHFYLGRFYSKLIESDTNRKIYNLKKSEECYKYIVTYIEKNPNHTTYITNELSVAEEMLELMPQRIAQVTGTTVF